MANELQTTDFDGWRTLAHMFFDRVDDRGDAPFVAAKRNKQWVSWSWREVEQMASAVSRGLRTQGIEPGDRVVLAAENSPEWLVGELAILMARAIAVPAYTTNTASDHAHIINNVSAKAAIVSSAKLAKPLLEAASASSHCNLVIRMEEGPEAPEGVTLVAWDALMNDGAAQPDDTREYESTAARTDTAVIIHTSGTGGAPKGVMLSHGSIIANCMGAYAVVTNDIDYGREKFLSFLPLSHAYEHMAGLWLPIAIGAEIHYAQSIDTLVNDMAEVQPTVMTAVPRLYEVMHARVVKAMKDAKGLKKTLFDKAQELGRRRVEGQSLGLGGAVLDRVTEKLVREKVRGRFGGRLKFFVSGGAPLNHDIGMFFTSLGVKLLQGYGQTEAAPLISVNPPNNAKIHTVGPAVHGVDVRIADDGEICVRGELVMKGYWNDDDSTRQVIREGWLCTGDIGNLDEDQHIVITDRKKDLIVNSGGDNISPQRVEGYLCVEPEIGQAMVLGDQRPHLVAIVVPDMDEMRQWARENGKPTELDKLADDPAFRDWIGQAIERANRQLSRIEQVRRFTVSPEEFTTDNEMLTPSMKVRRHMVKAKYGDQMEALYQNKKGAKAGTGDAAPAGAAKPAAA